MLMPETVNVEGRNFQLLPMPLLEAMKWDRKVGVILAPLLGALDALESTKSKPSVAPTTDSSTEEVDLFADDAPVASEEDAGPQITGFVKVAECLQRALTTLPDSEVSALTRGMLARVTYIPDAGQPILLNNDRGIDTAFEGLGPISIYKLMYEVARFNKFSPFALAGNGSSTAGILGSLVPGLSRGIRLG